MVDLRNSSQAAINGFLATGHHAAPRRPSGIHATTATRRAGSQRPAAPVGGAPFGYVGYGFVSRVCVWAVTGLCWVARHDRRRKEASARVIIAIKPCLRERVRPKQ